MQENLINNNGIINLDNSNSNISNKKMKENENFILKDSKNKYINRENNYKQDINNNNSYYFNNVMNNMQYYLSKK